MEAFLTISIILIYSFVAAAAGMYYEWEQADFAMFIAFAWPIMLPVMWGLSFGRWLRKRLA